MTIQDFRLDYSPELHAEYMTLGDYETAEQYIKENYVVTGVPILDFAAACGAKAARDLLSYYEKGYDKTVVVEPILIEVSGNDKEEILFTLEQPTFVAIRLVHTNAGMGSSAVLNALLFTMKESKVKLKRELNRRKLNRYETALHSARMFELLLLKKITIEQFKERIEELNPKCGYGDAFSQDSTTDKFFLNSRDNRFEQLTGDGPNSYWHHISFTDFQDDDDNDPSEEECRRIEVEINEIGDRVQVLLPPKDKEVSQLWNEALESAKYLENVWTKKAQIHQFIKELEDKFKDKDPHFKGAIKEDRDRKGNLITGSDRFYSILYGSNSLWEFLTGTDFDLDDGVAIPSQQEIAHIEEHIRVIRARLQSM